MEFRGEDRSGFAVNQVDSLSIARYTHSHRELVAANDQKGGIASEAGE
jgi:hypothetical protein